MPKYVIERELAGANLLTPLELKTAAIKAREAIRELGTDIQWVESYVTDNKFFCVYIAASEDLIRQHAEKTGFPCNAVREVHSMMSPTTAE